MKNWIYIALIFVLGCAEKPETEQSEIFQPEPRPEDNISPEDLMEVNKNWTLDESFHIDQFVKRHNWDAIKTETGLRYSIYHNGDGEQAKSGMVAFVNYEIRLLNADTSLCYNSNPGEPQDFLIEMDNVESGLHEGMSYMHVGDKAFIILPHYLAHGLLGDLDKIPPLSPVLYDIELVDVKPYNP